MKTHLTYYSVLLCGLILFASCKSDSTGESPIPSITEIDSLDKAAHEDSVIIADTLVEEVITVPPTPIPVQPPPPEPHPYPYPEPEPIFLPEPPPFPVFEDTIDRSKQIIDFPDVEATFPGGDAEMMKYIKDNLEYPQISIENDHQGRVFISFVVEIDGKLSQVKILRGISPELDKEAKRMIRSMPEWIPAQARGRDVRSLVRLPIKFKLSD